MADRSRLVDEAVMVHSSEELLRRGCHAFSSGDISTFFAVFADGISWHVADVNDASDYYHGNLEVMEPLREARTGIGRHFQRTSVISASKGRCRQ